MNKTGSTWFTKSSTSDVEKEKSIASSSKSSLFQTSKSKTSSNSNNWNNSDDEDSNDGLFITTKSKTSVSASKKDNPASAKKEEPQKKSQFESYGWEEIGDDDENDKKNSQSDGEQESSIDYGTFNLNKLTNEELQKHKDRMDKKFQRNSLKPGDIGYVYDKQEVFHPQEENEWDLEVEDDIV